MHPVVDRDHDYDESFEGSDRQQVGGVDGDDEHDVNDEDDVFAVEDRRRRSRSASILSHSSSSDAGDDDDEDDRQADETMTISRRTPSSSPRQQRQSSHLNGTGTEQSQRRSAILSRLGVHLKPTFSAPAGSLSTASSLVGRLGYSDDGDAGSNGARALGDGSVDESTLRRRYSLGSLHLAQPVRGSRESVLGLGGIGGGETSEEDDERGGTGGRRRGGWRN